MSSLDGKWRGDLTTNEHTKSVGVLPLFGGREVTSGFVGTYSGDELEAVLVDRADEDRLEHAMLAYRCRELLQRGLVEREPRLLGVGLDAVDGDHLDTRRAVSGLG